MNALNCIKANDVPKTITVPRTDTDNPILSNWCNSTCEAVKLYFEWTIQHFKRVKYEEIVSDSFAAKETPYLQWNLHFLSHRYFKLVLKNEESNFQNVAHPVTIEYNFFILNSEGVRVIWSKGLHSFPNSGNLYIETGMYMKDYDGYLTDEAHFTMHCKIVTWINRKTTTGEFARELPVVLPNNDELINDLSGLFGNEKYSDVVFDIRGQQFKAHKNILSARSSVFSEMFQHEGLEASHQVNIQDIDPEVFQEVLRFIYTGHVPSTKMDALGLGLLAAGEKYLLKNLKNACEKHLVNSLSAENCVEFIMVARSSCADYLKKNALDFLRRFSHEVRATNAWNKAHPIFLRNIHEIDLATPPACKKRK